MDDWTGHVLTINRTEKGESISEWTNDPNGYENWSGEYYQNAKLVKEYLRLNGALKAMFTCGLRASDIF